VLTFRKYDDDLSREALDRELLYTQPGSSCPVDPDLLEEDDLPDSDLALPAV
jgi:hypothetical protein